MLEREQLEQAITIQESLRPMLGDAVVDATIAALRQKLDALQTQPAAEQRKQITVLFADLHNFTSMSETLDAEEVSDMMNALWRRIDTAITNHGGTVDKHMGDAVMALWGAEVAHEDDPERALRAALAMQAEVAEFVKTNLRKRLDSHPSATSVAPDESVLRMRIGINTGPVLLGNVGTKGEFTALGDTVNLASRLEHAAPVGGILISHDTYRQIRGVFDVQALTPLTVKGKAEPVAAYIVERAKPRAFRVRARGVEGIETRMIGRESELQRMLDALETVIEDRQMEAITVIGDAGLGKSRLLFEFNNEVELLPHRVRVFNGRGSEATRGLPYSLVRDIFFFRFEIKDSDTAAVAREKLEQGVLALSGQSDDATMHAHFIGHLIGLDFSASPHLSGILDDAKQIRSRAFHYAAQFFTATTRDKPAIIFLDDLHWADNSSLDFVDHLARACVSIPLLILCFARPALLERRPSWGEGQAAHTRIALHPLSKRESRQLVEEILREAQNVPQALRELVVSGAEGNPFYVEELIKMLIDQKVIVPGADEWKVDASRLVEVRVPPTLTGVLQARLDGLSGWEKTVLQRASVIGRKFWDRAVEWLGNDGAEVQSYTNQATGEGSGGDVRTALESLRRKELIFRREATSFAGTSEYIFKHALLRDVTYESVLKRERRALHSRAAEWLTQGDTERSNVYAGAIAAHYESARESFRAAEWYKRAGQQAREAHAPEMAIGHYRKALEFIQATARDGDEDEAQHAARSTQRIDLYERLGEVLWVQARFTEAVEAYTAMRSLAEAGNDEMAQARAWNGLALVQEKQGDYRAMLDSARRAEVHARASCDGSSVNASAELAFALARQGWAFYRFGDAAAVMTLSEEALALTTELGETARRERANSLRLLGVAHQISGHFEQAYFYKEQALALLRELGDRQGVALMLNSLGVTSDLRGDFATALTRTEEALAIAREIGDRSGELTYLGNLGAARIGLEDYVAAEKDLREVIEMAGEAEYFGLAGIYRPLAEAYLGQGKIAEALEAATRSLALGQETGNQEYIGSAWRTLGMVAARSSDSITVNANSCDAGACFVESLRVFTEMGAEAERARTLREWARDELRRGEQMRGRELWHEAQEIFARLGMDLEVERMMTRPI